MAEHSTLTGASLHEPKGADTAAIREIFVADGAGSGTWQKSLLSSHGEMVIETSVTATNTSAAADSTLNTDTDYTKVTAGWSAGHLLGVTFNADEIVVPVDGDYYIAFWADIKVPKNNNFVGIKYAVNDGTPYSTRKLVSQSKTTNDFLNLAGMGMVASMAAGDTISVCIASSQADALIVQEAGLMCFLLHEV